MSVNNLLLWHKWRPKKIEDIVLLPRIRKQFENGITQHYIFHGHHGTGKTSLAKILIGVYDKSVPCLEVNCSLDTSIEVLRDEVDKFCRYSSIMETNSGMKYVYLDEFERVSKNFQDGFKAFIEKYNDNVRFIMGTNHIDKITPELKSRIKMIDFNCRNVEEEKFMKVEFYKRVKDLIIPKEDKEITKDILVNIINKRFPDLRNILVEVQDYLEVGVDENITSNISNKLKIDLYNLIYDKSKMYNETYHFLMDNFGPEKINSLIEVLGRPFINWSIENSKNVEKLFECNYIISDYSTKLETNTDPIVLGMTIIGKFRDILN